MSGKHPAGSKTRRGGLFAVPTGTNAVQMVPETVRMATPGEVT